MLLDITRSRITVQVGERRATIQGELCHLDEQRTGFVIYTDTMASWDAPNQDLAITAKDRAQIIHVLSMSLAMRGQTLLME
jgi:hypothetical protein